MAENNMNETETGMSEVVKARRMIEEARPRGRGALLKAYVRLSGPGWLQSAITLGGGSLSASLYLGVLAGFSLLWLQPLAMIIGVIMLSAISYVTLSTGKRPFRAINEHVNPVLGWGWLIATLMANCVWSLPQFALACKAFRQNLLPGTFANIPEGVANGILVVLVAGLCLFVVYLYDTQGLGYKIFDILLKCMVALIVISFVGVVIKLSAVGDIPWGKLFAGMIPNPRLLWTPAKTFDPFIQAVGEGYQDYWTGLIVSAQQDRIVAAAATAVGINMTFLLPYSMLKRGWNREFRGLAIFDLSTGLFIPFILTTGCVVIAAAQQFHTVPAPGLLGEIDKNGQPVAAEPGSERGFHKFAVGRLKFAARKELEDEIRVLGENPLEDGAMDSIANALIQLSPGERRLCIAKLAEELATTAQPLTAEKLDSRLADLTADTTPDQLGKNIQSLPLADRRMAAMLINRDNIHLAKALAPLTGDFFAHYVFGIGVVGMAISSIIILMLINGFCVCEAVGRPSHGWLYRVGCVVPAVGALGPFVWKGAAPYLAMPTSVFGFILIPIAYTTFALLLNQSSLLGENMPKGRIRTTWNVLMAISVVLVFIGSVYMAWKKTQASFLGSGWYGVGGIMGFVLLALIVHFLKKPEPAAAGPQSELPATDNNEVS